MANREEAARFAQTVAAQVRAEIAAASQTVAGLARATGINRETLDRWVKGERDLSVPTLYRIAVALGVDPHRIIQRAEERFAAGIGPSNVTPFPQTQEEPDIAPAPATLPAAAKRGRRKAETEPTAE